MDEGTAPMTSALANAPARLPAAAAATSERAPVRANEAARAARTTPATDAAREGARAIARDAPDDAAREDERRATARPGAATAPAEDPKSSKHDRAVTKLADRADHLFTQLVRQRDLIRRAVEFGDDAAALQAFQRARELFSEIVAIGNEADIDVSSSTDSAAVTDAKERIAHRVQYAYEWAGLIEDAMPGDHTL